MLASQEGLVNLGIHGDLHILVLDLFLIPLFNDLLDPFSKWLADTGIDHVGYICSRQLQHLLFDAR